MPKPQTVYVCSACGAEHVQWQGQCSACNEWNSLSKLRIGSAPAPKLGFSGAEAQVRKLSEVETEASDRLATGFGELDRVLGGGLVPAPWC